MFSILYHVIGVLDDTGMYYTPLYSMFSILYHVIGVLDDTGMHYTPLTLCFLYFIM